MKACAVSQLRLFASSARYSEARNGIAARIDLPARRNQAASHCVQPPCCQGRPRPLRRGDRRTACACRTQTPKCADTRVAAMVQAVRGVLRLCADPDADAGQGQGDHRFPGGEAGSHCGFPRSSVGGTRSLTVNPRDAGRVSPGAANETTPMYGTSKHAELTPGSPPPVIERSGRGIVRCSSRVFQRVDNLERMHLQRSTTRGDEHDRRTDRPGRGET